MDKIKIVIADDHQILIDGLVSFFHETGRIEVIGQANDGATLLRELYESRPDIVLLDLNMPKMGGIEFLKELRKDDDLKNISVFVMTTSNEDNDKVDAYSLNVAGYILKPLSMENFVTAVSTLKNYWMLCEYPE